MRDFPHTRDGTSIKAVGEVVKAGMTTYTVAV